MQTKLSDADVERIWNQRARSFSNEFRGAVYHLDKEYSTLNKPIPFNIEKINNGMEYSNGVFLILEPGYYRITTNIKTRDNRLDAHTMKNSHEILYHSSLQPWDASSTYYVAHLQTYDMISVELKSTATVGIASVSNFFQIEKVY